MFYFLPLFFPVKMIISILSIYNYESLLLLSVKEYF